MGMENLSVGDFYSAKRVGPAWNCVWVQAFMLCFSACRPDLCRLRWAAPPCSVFAPRRRRNFEWLFLFFFTLISHHKSTGFDTPHLPSVILRARESGSVSPLLPSGLELAASMARVCRRGFPTFLHHEPGVFGDMLQSAAAGWTPWSPG
jgi:hypothetical protein